MNSNVENLPPHIIRLVYKEVTTLTADPPDGIKVFPNEEDLTDLQVTIEGPGPDATTTDHVHVSCKVVRASNGGCSRLVR
uniref:Uncharacterized protein n=1 Tax=Felis catus TaxID=9685 RepID=A0ABI7ZZQ6_FELCA